MQFKIELEVSVCLPEKHGIQNPFQTLVRLCLVHYDLQLGVAVERVCLAGVLIRLQKKLQQPLVAKDPFAHGHGRIDEGVGHLPVGLGVRRRYWITHLNELKQTTLKFRLNLLRIRTGVVVLTISFGKLHRT